MPPAGNERFKNILSRQSAQINQLSKRLDRVEAALGERIEPVKEPEKAAKKTSSTRVENPTNLFKVFGAVGVLMIILGAVYFYKYAVDNGWIGITGRIALGVLASAILLGSGIFLFYRQYTNYSQIIISCGLGLLYFTFFATYHFTKYREALGMNLFMNTILLMLVMAGGTLISLKLNARFIAYGSLLLGFIAAFLSGIDGKTLHILVYILLMDMVILAIAKFKSWYLGIPAQILTYAAYGIWYAQGIFSPKSIISQSSMPVFSIFFFLAAYYALFTALSFVQSSDRKAKEAVGLTVINTVALAGFGLGIINKYYPELNGLYLLLIAGLTLGIGFAAKKLNLENIFELCFVETLALVAIAIPVQFDKTIVTVLWSLMSVGLVYAAVRIDHRNLLYVGYFGYIIPLLRVFMIDLWFLKGVERWLAVGSCLAGLIVIQTLIMTKYTSEKAHQDSGFNVYSGIGILLGAVWIAREVLQLHMPSDSRQVLLSVIWAAYAIGLIVYGVLRSTKLFTWAGVLTFGVVVVKILIVDLSSLPNISRVIALVVVGGLALIGSFTFVKNRETLRRYV